MEQCCHKKQNIVFNSEIEYELGSHEIDIEQLSSIGEFGRSSVSAAELSCPR